MSTGGIILSKPGFSLKAPPAFSYETKKCNASTTRTVYYKMRELFTEQNICTEGVALAQKQRVRGNVMKVAGYFPLVGCGVAVWRVSKMRTNHEFSENKFNHVLRAILEFLGLGLLCLPVDGIMTGARQTTRSASDGEYYGRRVLPFESSGIHGGL